MPTDESRKNFRLTNDEVDLLKKTFNGNQPLLLALEHALLQIPLDTIEMSLMEITFKGKELITILKKHILQELSDKGVAFGGTRDYLMGLEIKDIYPDILALRVKALKIFEKYIQQQLEAITKREWNLEQPIRLDFLAEIDDLTDQDIYINMFARNIIIYTIQQQLVSLMGISGQKELTKAEQEEQDKKDSLK